MAPRKTLIVHVDIDAFFAAVEQVLDPRLKGKPVIVGNGCIASCSYEARRFGLSAGMSLREAAKRCPDVIILDGSEKVYRCYSRNVFDLCLRIAPSIETFLDD
jgi:DNA polymerase-4